MNKPALKVFTETIPSMTSELSISVVFDHSKETQAKYLIRQGFEEANRLIGIISAWQEGTELFRVNEQAGIRPVKVGDELFYLVQRGIKISELTEGLFDITFASIDKIWYFDKPMVQKPEDKDILHSVRNIDYRFVCLDEKEKTIFITHKGTKIELGAIGKGFIANKIQLKLQSSGVESGLVNAGGDLITWGYNEEGKPWKVGIADPNKKEKYLAWLSLHNQAVATSGCYERFVEFDGERYTHIIHPKTGYPVKGISSVTVIASDAELCDAVATSVFLLGVREGLDFVNRFHDLQCFIIDEQQQYYYSDNLKKTYYEEVAS